MESITSKGNFLPGLIVCFMLNGCAASGIISALSSVGTPGVAASLQVGDKEVEVAKDADIKVGSKQENSQVTSSIQAVTAQKEAKIDQSSQKQDKKTEIGEVQGDVKVSQGPSAGLLAFLASGWILLSAIPLLVIWFFLKRGQKNVGTDSRTPIEGDDGAEGSSAVLEDELLSALRMAEELHKRI